MISDNIEYLMKSKGINVTIMIGETDEGELFCLVDRDKSVNDHVMDMRILRDSIKPLRAILDLYTMIERKLEDDGADEGCLQR